MTSDRTRSGFKARAAASAASPSAAALDPIAGGAQQALDVMAHVEIVVGQQNEMLFAPLRQLGQVLQFRHRCRVGSRAMVIAEPARHLLHIGLRPHAGRCAARGSA